MTEESTTTAPSTAIAKGMHVTAATMPTAPVAMGAGESTATTVNRLSMQLKKVNEANGKYKNLLKLAKERIQQQEEEIERLRKVSTNAAGGDDHGGNGEDHTIAAQRMVLLEDDQPSRIGEGDLHISRVYQRVRVRTDRPDHEEIWALLEMEVIANTDLMENSTRRFREWKRFNTESELQDFIRRDVGEPVTLPPYSFSPEQSAAIQQEAAGEVAKITEEFRRFRVRAELTRKQLDSQIRDLQSANVLNAAKRIEANGSDHYREHRSDEELERTRAALAAQETRWKEAYDLLLAENKALKSTGSEALLASQWRQRYETCLKEKEDLESRLNQDDQNKYEEKYRDLKESFRLYRKKAKEIFEQQQHNGAVSTSSISNLASTSSADAKLSYLKNLMLNYLTADPAVRDHMQVAIGTVLQFTTDELDKIEKKKQGRESWF